MQLWIRAAATRSWKQTTRNLFRLSCSWYVRLRDVTDHSGFTVLLWWRVLQVSHVQAMRRQAVGVLDAVVDTALLRALVRVRAIARLVAAMV
jgi:hypothetical protein